MSTRTVLILVGLAAGVALFACGGTDRTSWQPTESPTGSELHIGVYVGGCDSFDTIAIRETDEDVTLQAYVNDNVKTDCPAILNFERRTVELRAPLGSRPLLGCNPSGAIYTLPDDVSNEDCAAAIHP